MYSKQLFSTLVLATLAGGAQAATWVFEVPSPAVSGYRIGELTVDGELPSPILGDPAGDPILGGAGGFSLYGDSYLDHTSSAGNAMQLSLQQEGYGSADALGDGKQARLETLSLASVDGQFIVPGTAGAATNLSITLSQSFRIAAELGESSGQAVLVSGSALFDRYSDVVGNASHTFLLEAAVNGVTVETILTPPIFQNKASFDFLAAIDDVVTLTLTTQLGMSLPEEVVDAGDFSLLAYSGQSATLTISPIPEPETYAMLLAGLGLLGFVVRRKQ